MGHKDKGIRNYNPSLAAQNTPAGKAYLNKIRKLEPYERLLYWIKERYSIHITRFPNGYFAPQPYFSNDPIPRFLGYEEPYPEESDKPWTDDPIFQNVFFCNVYRENDRVTTYLRDNYRQDNRNEPHVCLGTILLRWFNFIPTMSRLIDAGIPQSFRPPQKNRPPIGRNDNWILKPYEKLLIPARDADEQIFGGAYIIRPVVDGPDGEGVRKVEAIGALMTHLAKSTLSQQLTECDMSAAFDLLTSYKGMGPFYCYQFIGDLAYTHVLKDASDWLTWSFCGPGTARGLVRLEHPSGKSPELPRQFHARPGDGDKLLELQEKINKSLKLSKPTGRDLTKYKQGGEVRAMQYIHMRDLTNTLCEFDKYERALYNERSLKRPYKGSA